MIGRTVVVGFGYKARRGKDTAVSAILRHVENSDSENLFVCRYAFSDALRAEICAAAVERGGIEALCEWAGVPYVEGAEKQRALMQWWGTDYRRAQDPEYWVKTIAEQIAADQPAYALISDMRFLNEFEFCDYALRLDRPHFEIADGQHHVSEHQLDVMTDQQWWRIITSTCAEQVEEQAIKNFGIIRQMRESAQ